MGIAAEADLNSLFHDTNVDVGLRNEQKIPVWMLECKVN
jgi:hypothetical protein